MSERSKPGVAFTTQVVGRCTSGHHVQRFADILLEMTLKNDGDVVERLATNASLYSSATCSCWTPNSWDGVRVVGRVMPTARVHCVLGVITNTPGTTTIERCSKKPLLRRLTGGVSSDADERWPRDVPKHGVGSAFKQYAIVIIHRISSIDKLNEGSRGAALPVCPLLSADRPAHNV